MIVSSHMDLISFKGPARTPYPPVNIRLDIPTETPSELRALTHVICAIFVSIATFPPCLVTDV